MYDNSRRHGAMSLFIPGCYYINLWDMKMYSILLRKINIMNIPPVVL